MSSTAPITRPRLLRPALGCLCVATATAILIAPVVVVADPLLPLATITCALWLGAYVLLLTLALIARPGAGHLGRGVRCVAVSLLTILPALTLVAVLERWMGVADWVFALPLAAGVCAQLLLLHRALCAMGVTVARSPVSHRDRVEV